AGGLPRDFRPTAHNRRYEPRKPNPARRDRPATPPSRPAPVRTARRPHKSRKPPARGPLWRRIDAVARRAANRHSWRAKDPAIFIWVFILLLTTPRECCSYPLWAVDRRGKPCLCSMDSVARASERKRAFGVENG